MNSPAHMTVMQEEPAKFTTAEFLALVKLDPIASWPGKTELVGGVITRMAPAYIPHWNAQRVVFAQLYEAMKAEPPIWIVGQEPTVRLAGDTIRQPDIALLRDVEMVGDVFDRAALFLAIEIADTSLPLDLGTKQRDYATAFVPHYWVVDINGRTIRIMSDPVRGHYQRASSIDYGVQIAVPGTAQTIVID